MEQRVVAQRIIDAAAEQEAVLLDMSDDELDSDDEEYLADLQREIAELIVALTWVEPQDTKAGQRVSDLDKWSEDEVYLLFKFRKCEIERLVSHLRLPDVIRVNGSKFSKLEAVLCILMRFSTAGQLHQLTGELGLHSKRLSELKNEVCRILYEEHARVVLTTLEPWVDSFPYFAESAGNVSYLAGILNLVAFVDGHFREVCRPIEYQADGHCDPYGPKQKALHSGHKKLPGWTWEATHLINGLTGMLRGPIEARRGERHVTVSCFLNII